MKLNSQLIAIAMVAMMVVMTTPEPVQARAWEWAKRLPVNQYSPEDIEILKTRMGEILSSLKDGETGEWSNPETGHGGSIMPLTSVEQSGKLCRQTRFKSESNGQENVSEFFLCRQPDGVWAVEQPAVQ